MKDLNYRIKQLCFNNRDGSFRTQEERLNILNQAANDLHSMGYRRIAGPANLKPKHVFALVKRWSDGDPSAGVKPIAVGTIKNRMVALRWLARTTANHGLVASSNARYGIPDRSFVSGDKALDFSRDKIEMISDRNVQLSAYLQKAFGLRREEAIKFNVSVADKGTHISLKPGWCKGGRARDIPVTTEYQRSVLNSVRQHAGNGSLIPSRFKYVQQMRVFEKCMKAVGLGRSHGARHQYAQDRYEALTLQLLNEKTGALYDEGLKCVAKGGMRPGQMNDLGRLVDHEARQLLSRELGHERIQICSVYLGG